jgi:hypothetical protein
MSRVILPLKTNSLAFPGRAPGFDPSHFAAQGMSNGNGFSGVTVAGGSNFINLLSTKAGVFTGSGTGSIFGGAGPVLNLTGSNNYLSFAGNVSNAPAGQTVGGIGFIQALTSKYPLFNVGGSAVGLVLGVNNNVLWCFGESGGDINSSLTLQVNTPYFFAVSVNATLSIENFILVNLLTGQVKTQQMTSAIGFGFAGGTYLLGNDTFSENWNGGIAAAMYAPNFLSIPQLIQWAQAPWTFWYPRTLDLVDMLSAGSGTPDVLMAQAWM